MKNIKTFEEWSPKFNKTLQSAYQSAISIPRPDNVTKDIIAYAKKQVTAEEFKLYDNKGSEFVISMDGNFIIQPVNNIRWNISPLTGNQNSNEIHIEFDVLLKKITAGPGNVSGFKEGEQALLDKSGNIVTESKARIKFDNSSYLNEKGGCLLYTQEENRLYGYAGQNAGVNLRFENRISLENFISMFVQAVMSDPEPESDFINIDIVHNFFTQKDDFVGVISGKEVFNKLPGNTTRKKLILYALDKLVLANDMRKYTR